MAPKKQAPPKFPAGIKFYPPLTEAGFADRIKKAAKRAGKSSSEWIFDLVKAGLERDEADAAK